MKQLTHSLWTIISMFSFSSSKNGFNIDYSAYDAVPSALMVCELPDFTISYINPSSMELLRNIESLLPCPVDELIGKSIDIFHKQPEHQRGILADDKNLPHTAQISLGEEKLRLEIVARYNQSGDYIGPLLQWSVVTDRVKAEGEAYFLRQIIEQMPINTMFMEADSFKITYMNRESTETLKKLQHLLPCDVDEIVGQSVDIFHKEPEHQRKILADPSNLPHRARISLGNEHLELRISAVSGRGGSYLGAMVTWEVVTSQKTLTDEIKNVVVNLSSAAQELENSANTMQENASQTDEKASSVSATTEQLTASINEISEQVIRSSNIARNAVTEVEKSNEFVSSLSENVDEIGQVVDLINDIAGQTNLLALNATIEAARAGEAGKGFAVVASEVKNLAEQTGKATNKIVDQIGAIQGSTTNTVNSIQSVGETIKELDSIASGISAAVEEQAAATSDVSDNTNGVSHSSSEAGRLAKEMLESIGLLKSQSRQLEDEVGQFIETMEK